MKVIYDAETDVLRIMLSDAPIKESNEDQSGVILDYDEAGNVVGIEVLSASTRVTDPRSLEHTVVG
jgi:YD repeat-containing protein